MVKEEDLLDLSEVMTFVKTHPFAEIQTRHGYEHLVISMNLHNEKGWRKIRKVMGILR